MPTGASGISPWPPDCFDACWILRSISRMPSRYSLSRVAVACRKILLKARHFGGDGIENAGVLLLARAALLGGAAIAEQAFENYLRAVLHGRGSVGVRQDIVL